MTVGISGTGGGFKKFARGETDISDASRPILKAEMETAKEAGIEFIELPVCFDALTVAVHPDADWVDSITVEELKKIWEPEAEGKITHWNQIRPEWPNEKLVLFGAGTDSGTFDYFTEAINGKAKASRGDFTASEDDNTLVTGIERQRACARVHSLCLLRTQQVEDEGAQGGCNGQGNGSRTQCGKRDQRRLFAPFAAAVHLRQQERRGASGSEEVRGVLFEECCRSGHGSEVRSAAAEAYAMASERFAKMETGSGFGGVPEVGLPIDEILKRTPQH